MRVFVSSYPSADMFVLLSWCCGIYSVALAYNPHFTSSPAWSPLVGSMASLLDLILNKSHKARPSVQKSSLVRTRRALRSVGHAFMSPGCVTDCQIFLQNPGNIPMAIKTLISRAKGHSNPLSVVPLLGVAIDVKLRLKNLKDDSLRQVEGDLKVLHMPLSVQHPFTDIVPG